MKKIHNSEGQNLECKAVLALMRLRGLTSTELAKQTHVDDETLKAFLSGRKTVLSTESLEKIYNFLGLDSSLKMKPEIQYWKLRGDKKSHEVNLKLLSVAVQLFKLHDQEGKGVQLVEILFGANAKKGLWKREATYAIKCETARIIITVEGTALTPPVLIPGQIPGLSWNENLPSRNGRCSIEKYYYDLLRNTKLNSAEFDEIFSGATEECSWNNIVQICREHKLTPTAVRDLVALEIEKSLEKEQVMVQAKMHEQEMKTPADPILMRPNSRVVKMVNG